MTVAETLQSVQSGIDGNRAGYRHDPVRLPFVA
jgi:hypothetical protein